MTKAFMAYNQDGDNLQATACFAKNHPFGNLVIASKPQYDQVVREAFQYIKDNPQYEWVESKKKLEE